MLLTAQNLSDVRVCDVALEVGFSDISYFNKLFRSRFGDTPKGVRKKSLASNVPRSEPEIRNRAAALNPPF
jgi:AraC-like DNA-binding protein